MLKLLSALLLMASCVVIHASGITWALQRLGESLLLRQKFWQSMVMCVRLAGWIIACHMIEILVWAVFYWLDSAMPDLPSSAYFSAVTYTTTGYGDIVLAPAWRLVGAVEALTGILMCGWSTGFFFAVVSRLHVLDGAAGSR